MCLTLERMFGIFLNFLYIFFLTMFIPPHLILEFIHLTDMLYERINFQHTPVKRVTFFICWKNRLFQMLYIYNVIFNIKHVISAS